jgi:dihydrofolate reductase
MELALIAAIGKRGELGLHNALLWHLPDDLRFFKKTTMGAPLLMGRKTFDSIGRPLPGRRTLVITRNTGFSVPGTEAYHSIEDAINACKEVPRVFVAGGAEVYALALPLADVLFVTHVDGTFEADTFFPEMGEEWTCVYREEHPADDKHAYAFVHCEYRRRS